MSLSERPIKTPVRMCVILRKTFPKSELIRIVLNKDKQVIVDKTGQASGRGAYILLKKELIVKAKLNKAIDKALAVTVPQEIYEQLLELLNE